MTERRDLILIAVFALLTHFTYFALSDKEWADQQIRCWKRNPQVDLVSSGGHEAKFDGRRVFPLRFILRHYPIRGQAHGERKLFVERKPRFSPEERAKRWHIQYDRFQPGTQFLRDPKELTRWDPTRVRLDLALRFRRLDELTNAIADLPEGERGRMRAAHQRLVNRSRAVCGCRRRARDSGR